jgi:hypothetical protein
LYCLGIVYCWPLWGLLHIVTTTTHNTCCLLSCEAFKLLLSITQLLLRSTPGDILWWRFIFLGNLIPSLQPIVRTCKGIITCLTLNSCTLRSAYFWFLSYFRGHHCLFHKDLGYIWVIIGLLGGSTLLWQSVMAWTWPNGWMTRCTIEVCHAYVMYARTTGRPGDARIPMRVWSWWPPG